MATKYTIIAIDLSFAVDQFSIQKWYHYILNNLKYIDDFCLGNLCKIIYNFQGLILIFDSFFQLINLKCIDLIQYML